MRKYLNSLLLTAILVAALVAPVSAQVAPQDFVDVQSQTSQSGIEHWVFWEQYLNAFYGTDDGIRYWHTPSINYWADTAMNQWNATNYGNMDNSVEVSNASDADLEILYQNCPAGGPGCVEVTSWQALGGHNVNAWKKAKIYVRVNPAGGPNWTTAGLIAAIAHEFGHLVGLGDQYSYWDNPFTCNFGTDPSLMDTVKIVNNTVDPCDHSNLTSADTTRLNTFWETGEYTHQSYEFPCGTSCAESWNVDRAWNDWAIQVWWMYADSPGGTQWLFFYETHVLDNGSHVAVVPATNIKLKSRVYPPSNLHGKWLRSCTRPALYEDSGGTVKYGTYKCADNWMYWP